MELAFLREEATNEGLLAFIVSAKNCVCGSKNSSVVHFVKSNYIWVACSKGSVQAEEVEEG
jgi:hypothetical protein